MNSVQKSNVDILVPHKNQPKKLLRLLKTIPRGINVIVVDDDSTEFNFNECREQIHKHFPNVKFLKNESGTYNAGVARNIALKNSNAEWVIFADADDLFYTNELVELITFIEATNSDLVFFDVNAVMESDGSPSSRTDAYSNLIKLWPTNKATIAYQWVVPWGKAIRKRPVIDANNLQFASRIVSNDVEFATNLATVTRSIEVFPKLTYCCTESSTSLTGTLNAEKARIRLIAASNRNMTLFRQRVPIHYNYNIGFFLKSLSLIMRDLDYRTVGIFIKNLYVAIVGNFFLNR